MASEIKKFSNNKVYYTGFSTSVFEENGQDFTTTNSELIRRDLYTEIMTEIGTRVKMPEFGTRIPTLTFEPNDTYTRDIVEEDVRKVIDNDPRVKLLDIQTVSLPDNNVIVVFADILYVELDLTDTLKVEVESQ